MVLLVLAVGVLVTCFRLNAQGVDVTAYGIMPNGERKANIKIVREEVERTTLLPLLPYVFFDENSTDIPKRYQLFTQRESRIFSEKEFGAIDPTGRRSSIAAYYNILNIVGNRLVHSPYTSITLTGSTDGKEALNVAVQRAIAVRNYLYNVFGVDTSRMVVKGQVYPASQSRLDNQLYAAQENRRVEIDGPWDIVKPVVVRDTTTSISPPGVEFEITSTVADVSEVVIRAWQLDYENPLYMYEHVELPKSARLWRLDRDPSKQPTTDEDVEYEAAVSDNKYRRYESETKTIPVEQITLHRKKSGMLRGSTELHQYNLILFDFASGALRSDHERIIDSLIATDGYVLPYSTINIIGYTDSTGTVQSSKRLSELRAKAAADKLLKRFEGILQNTSVMSEGIGQFDVLHLESGSSLPEARMYSRTVHIVVQNRRDQ